VNGDVAEAFDQFNRHISLADSDRTFGRERVEAISRALEQNSSVVRSLPFGSFARSTAIRRFSDVDLLVEFRLAMRVAGNGPQHFLDTLEGLAHGVVSDVSRHENSITLTYPEWPAIDLVPAIRSDADKHGGSAFLIPASEGGCWQFYKPHARDRQIEKRAQNLGGTFKGAIRMMKWWSKVKGGIVDSFEIEALACGQFVETMPPYPQAIYALFDSCLGLYLASKLRGERRTESSLSSLEEAHQIAREALRLSERIGPAEQKAAVETWRKLFGDQFPRPAR
jgi:predicted nucleotidyltransferase